MRINGYWLGIALIMLLDYIWFLFIGSDIDYFGLSSGITLLILIISLGWAFPKDNSQTHGKQKEDRNGKTN